MSIFSSWEEAPNSGVITYMATSATSTMAASPWPMPGVSMMTTSKPAARHAAMTDGRGGGTSDAEPRVARERKKIWSPPMAFMRIRSPSSAPPPRRRVGSMARTAMRSLSSWSSRNRRTSSSVSDDLPEPPVPVMPRTGAGLRAAAASSWARSPSGTAAASRPVMKRASAS